MARAMSQMSETELDFLYEQALHNESSKSIDWEDCNIEEDEAFDELDIPIWTDEDEAGLEEYEERRRQRIAERNEY